MSLDSSIYTDPSLYDAQYHTLTKDLRFYRKLAIESKGPVLEIGVGTGRLALPIVEAGIPFYGLDASSSMLEQARAALKSQRTPFILIEADFRTFALPQKFPFIFSGFNTLQHAFEPKDLTAVFSRVFHHLCPSGQFGFDIPAPSTLQSLSSDAHLRERFFDERLGQACEIWETAKYNTATCILRSNWEYRWSDGNRKTRTLTARMYSPEEFTTLLTKVGFRILHQLGDFDGGTFSASSARQIFVCQK
jgi:SAM-dependent methyltransferase